MSDDMVAAIGDAMGQLTSDLRREFVKQVSQLQRQVDQLEGRLDAMLRMSGGGAAAAKPKHLVEHESSDVIRFSSIRP